MPEEQAFCILVKLMYDYGLRDLYKDGFDSLYVRLYQLNRLMQVWTEVMKSFLNYHKVLNSGYPAYMSTFASIAMLYGGLLCIAKMVFLISFFYRSNCPNYGNISQKKVWSHTCLHLSGSSHYSQPDFPFILFFISLTCSFFRVLIHCFKWL